ncbi:MAG: hypothetical protein AB7W59_00165 [Acidimicrobiia bacterium]
MPYPNLLHPVPISIQVLDRSATVMDPDLREPIQNEARAATASCPGQVAWGSDQKLNARPDGLKEDSDGYVLFRLADLAARSITLKRDDRFTRLGTIDVDVYVVKLQYMGHYAWSAGPTLVKAFFKDLQPGRQTKGA